MIFLENWIFIIEVFVELALGFIWIFAVELHHAIYGNWQLEFFDCLEKFKNKIVAYNFSRPATDQCAVANAHRTLDIGLFWRHLL